MMAWYCKYCKQDKREDEISVATDYGIGVCKRCHSNILNQAVSTVSANTNDDAIYFQTQLIQHTINSIQIKGTS